MLGKLYENQDCSASRTLELVGERWSLLILRDAMFAGLTRFSQFQKRIGVATNILQRRLEDFVAAGLMEHHSATAGEQAEYTLTRKGLELMPVIVALTEWGDKWVRPGPISYREASSGALVALEMRRTDTSEVVDASSVKVVLRAAEARGA